MISRNSLLESISSEANVSATEILLGLTRSVSMLCARTSSSIDLHWDSGGETVPGRPSGIDVLLAPFGSGLGWRDALSLGTLFVEERLHHPHRVASPVNCNICRLET